VAGHHKFERYPFNKGAAGPLKFERYTFNKGVAGCHNLRVTPLIMVWPGLSNKRDTSLTKTLMDSSGLQKTPVDSGRLSWTPTDSTLFYAQKLPKI
jgi:hypothetical protein